MRYDLSRNWDQSDSNNHKQTLKLIAILVLLILAIFGIVFANKVKTLPTDIYEQVALDNVNNPLNIPKNCTLPKKDFPKYAFSVGVPTGWIDVIDNGTISIMQDDSNTVAAFIYTAKLEKDLSSKEFLQAFAEVFKTTIESSGGSFALGSIDATGTEAVASAQARVEEGDLRGEFQTQKDQGFVTFKAYWAPVDSFTTHEPTLKQIVSCFTRTTTVTDQIITASKDQVESDTQEAFKAYAGNYFKLSLPSSWQVTAETDSGIDTANATGSAGFSYAYVTGTSSAIDPESWAKERLPLVGVLSPRLANPQEITSQIEGQTVKSFDFDGTLKGKIVNGKITVGVYNTPDFGLGSYGSAFWGMQIAESALWPQLSSTTQKIQDSLELLDIGETRRNVTLPKGTSIDDAGGSAITSSQAYRDAVSDKSSQGWREAISGYETVESPSTGEKYDVPLNSWNSSGPAGAGYYRTLPGITGDVEKLDPIAP